MVGMLDIRFVRENADIVQENARRKSYDVNIAEILEWDNKKRTLQQQADEIREQRNKVASQIQKLEGESRDELVREGREAKEKLVQVEAALKEADETFTALFKKVPNMALDDVPVGTTEDENVVAKTWGELPIFAFTPKNHAEIAEAKGWLDKERASKVAGSRFAYIKGDLALLWFALLNFGISVLTNEEILKEIIAANNLTLSSKPFIPVFPPAVARTDVYDATARLNKEEQTYKLADDDLWLNASAEHTMAPMYLNEIVDEAQLPIRYVGYTTAFRREAGTYGKDMEGIFRLHQFNKLEMESFAAAETSYNEHLFMIAIQEYLMQQLGIPYRVMLKCTADIGGPNARGVDIDAWLPGQQKYRETHTADLITDFQTRRMNTRVRRKDGTLEMVHTNDATVFAERPMIAILENYQTQDGSVRVPDVLQPYLGGRTVL